MARHFANVSEQEIVAINEASFFYPSDLVNTKTPIPSGSVKSGGYIPENFASRYISTTIHLPFGGKLYNIYTYETHLAKDNPGVFPWTFFLQRKVAKKVHVFKYGGKRNSACAVID